MVTRFFTPHPALQTYVIGVAVLRADFDKPGSPKPVYQFMPNTARFLCFQLQDAIKLKNDKGIYEQRPASLFVGQHLKPTLGDLGVKNTNVLILFKPSGMYRLLGFNQQELLHKDVDARLLLGNEISHLLERLYEAKNDEQINLLIQKYLLGKLGMLRTTRPIDLAIDAIVQSGGRLSMDQAASLSSLSIRQFQRLALYRLGVSPKLFAKVARFSQAYKYKELHPMEPWSDIAYQYGYYDQMHFIRDFKFFTSATPGSLKEESIEKSVKLLTLLS